MPSKNTPQKYYLGKTSCLIEETMNCRYHRSEPGCSIYPSKRGEDRHTSRVRKRWVILSFRFKIEHCGIRRVTMLHTICNDKSSGNNQQTL